MRALRSGTGSYFAGLQAGYNYRLPSGIVISGEADFAAPSSITDHRTIASGGVGQASLAKTIELSGTLRGLTDASDRWTIKAIIEVPIDELIHQR